MLYYCFVCYLNFILCRPICSTIIQLSWYIIIMLTTVRCVKIFSSYLLNVEPLDFLLLLMLAPVILIMMCSPILNYVHLHHSIFHTHIEESAFNRMNFISLVIIILFSPYTLNLLNFILGNNDNNNNNNN